jgi:hypothetical protein
MNQTQHLHDFNVGANLAVLDAPAPAVLQVDSLTTVNTGKLDLTNERLIVVNGNVATIAAKIASGFNAGAWTGPGIITSVATSSTGLGISRADDANLAGSTFGGVPVAAADVLVAFTLRGDANLDQRVDFIDLVRLAQNYNTTAKGWWQGDFTYDGSVDFDDLVKLAQNYNSSLFPSAVPGAPVEFQTDVARAFASVPEPASALVIFAVCGLAGTKRPRR